jgi:hypothetical protein
MAPAFAMWAPRAGRLELEAEEASSGSSELRGAGAAGRQIGLPWAVHLISYTGARTGALSSLLSSDLGPQPSSHDCARGQIADLGLLPCRDAASQHVWKLRPHFTRAEATHRPSLAGFFISIAPESRVEGAS